MMKKFCAAMLLCTMLLSLCACQNTEKPETDDPSGEQVDPVTPETPDTPDSEDQDPAETGVVCTDETLEKTISNEQGEALISICLIVPKPENMPGVQQYYQDWLNDTAYYATLDEEAAAESLSIAKQMDTVFYPYTYESEYEIKRNDGVLLSISRSLYAETGGVHPNTTPMAETFVVETGAQLVLDDVFSVPADQYMPRIKELVIAMMDKNDKELGDAMYYDDARDTLTDKYNPKDFVMTDDSLMIFFPTYTLAPHAAGVQYFSIPFADISDIINPAWTTK